jgi:hypothetical protein
VIGIFCPARIRQKLLDYVNPEIESSSDSAETTHPPPKNHNSTLEDLVLGRFVIHKDNNDQSHFDDTEFLFDSSPPQNPDDSPLKMGTKKTPKATPVKKPTAKTTEDAQRAAQNEEYDPFVFMPEEWRVNIDFSLFPLPSIPPAMPKFAEEKAPMTAVGIIRAEPHIFTRS